jgi:hypothetical protein
VVFDRIEADSPTLGNVPIRHAVLNAMHDAPFCWRQHIIMRRSAAAFSGCHAAIVILGTRIFPPLLAYPVPELLDFGMVIGLAYLALAPWPAHGTRLKLAILAASSAISIYSTVGNFLPAHVLL